jgi:hypothetical protein
MGGIGIQLGVANLPARDATHRRRPCRPQSPGHHPISICSASPPLREMKSSAGGSAGFPENIATARSNVPHQALTGVERPR